MGDIPTKVKRGSALLLVLILLFMSVSCNVQTGSQETQEDSMLIEAVKTCMTYFPNEAYYDLNFRVVKEPTKEGRGSTNTLIECSEMPVSQQKYSSAGIEEKIFKGTVVRFYGYGQKSGHSHEAEFVEVVVVVHLYTGDGGLTYNGTKVYCAMESYKVFEE